MQSLKSAEQFTGVRHVEPGAIVPHEIGGFTVILGNAKFDPCPSMLGGKFPRIPEKILQHEAEQPRVALYRDFFRYNKLDLALFRILELRRYGSSQGAEVYRLALDLTPGYP
jgi:hypothetical protein